MLKLGSDFFGAQKFGAFLFHQKGEDFFLKKGVEAEFRNSIV